MYYDFPRALVEKKLLRLRPRTPAIGKLAATIGKLLTMSANFVAGRYVEIRDKKDNLSLTS